MKGSLLPMPCPLNSSVTSTLMMLTSVAWMVVLRASTALLIALMVAAFEVFLVGPVIGPPPGLSRRISAMQRGIGRAYGVTGRVGTTGPCPGEGAQQRLGDVLDQLLGTFAIPAGQRPHPPHRAGVEYRSAGLGGVIGGVGVLEVATAHGRVEHDLERPRHRMSGLNRVEFRSQSAR